MPRQEAWVPGRGVVVPYLERLRKRRALTQQDLAQAAGVSRGTVNRAEQGLAIDVAVVRKVAAALGVAPAQLMDGGEGAMDTR
jgi:transcriptional regulator with XRE-family HTH domain